MNFALLLIAAATIEAAAPSPHRVALSCAKDAAKFCPNEQGREARACLAQHHVSLSLVCRQALTAGKSDPQLP
jgi:hypothetical protein